MNYKLRRLELDLAKRLGWENLALLGGDVVVGLPPNTVDNHRLKNQEEIPEYYRDPCQMVVLLDVVTEKDWRVSLLNKFSHKKGLAPGYGCILSVDHAPNLPLKEVHVGYGVTPMEAVAYAVHKALSGKEWKDIE